MLTTRGVVTYTSKEDILNQFSQLSIFRMFAPEHTPIVLRKVIKSPLRKDNNPSFVLLGEENGTIVYYDFATGETGDCFDFAMEITGKSFKQILHSLSNRTNLPVKQIEQSSERRQDKSDFKFYNRRFNDLDKVFWESYNITRETLNVFNVTPVSFYLVNSSPIYPNTLCYKFKVGSRYKVYQPKNRVKYLGNTNKNSIQGYTQIDQLSDCLYIVSSLKEVMVMYELGYSAIAFNSESTLPKEEIMNYFKEIYDTIYVLYDWDESGRYFSELVSKKYGFINITSDKVQKTKDLSDFSKKYGLFELNKKIKNERNKIS
jgi:hypothetical protein